MNIFEKDFKNELGNAIRVRVSSREIDGVEGVVISISGPASHTESHVTRLEAEVICEQLKFLLQSKS